MLLKVLGKNVFKRRAARGVASSEASNVEPRKRRRGAPTERVAPTKVYGVGGGFLLVWQGELVCTSSHHPSTTL